MRKRIGAADSVAPPKNILTWEKRRAKSEGRQFAERMRYTNMAYVVGEKMEDADRKPGMKIDYTIPDDGVVFFYRFGNTEIRCFLMSSRNRIAVIGSSADSELCVPECSESVSSHHAVLIWLSGKVFIHRHPECQLPHEIILNCGSMYEQKLPKGLYAVYPDCIIRIGNIDVFALFPNRAIKLLGEEAIRHQSKTGTVESMDAIISEIYDQIRIQNEIVRNNSRMMVGYGPPPVF